MMLFLLPSTILFTVYHYFPSQLSSQNYAALYFYGIKIVFYFGISGLSVQKCVVCSRSAVTNQTLSKASASEIPATKLSLSLNIGIVPVGLVYETDVSQLIQPSQEIELG